MNFLVPHQSTLRPQSLKEQVELLEAPSCQGIEDENPRNRWDSPCPTWSNECIYYINWLVVWNMAFIFHIYIYILGIIIPIDSYFSDGLKPPTSIYIYDTKYDIIIVCCNHYQQLSHDMIPYDMTWCQWNVMNAIEKVHFENELYGVLAWLSFFHHQTWDNDPT